MAQIISNSLSFQLMNRFCLVASLGLILLMGSGLVQAEPMFKEKGNMFGDLKVNEMPKRILNTLPQVPTHPTLDTESQHQLNKSALVDNSLAIRSIGFVFGETMDDNTFRTKLLELFRYLDENNLLAGYMYYVGIPSDMENLLSDVSAEDIRYLGHLAGEIKFVEKVPDFLKVTKHSWLVDTESGMYVLEAEDFTKYCRKDRFIPPRR